VILSRFAQHKSMFDIANLSLSAIILLLRVAVVLLLYFFLWQVLRMVSRDLLSSAATFSPEQVYPHGRLVIINPGQTGLPNGKPFPLNPVTTIGRSLECDIAFNDTFLSTQHARLELRGDEWILEDLRSTNGTFLNGFEVRNATNVNDSDVIRVGRIELKLVK
jgi:hypothetical protein